MLPSELAKTSCHRNIHFHTFLLSCIGSPSMTPQNAVYLDTSLTFGTEFICAYHLCPLHGCHKVKFDEEQHLTFHLQIFTYLLCNLCNFYRTGQLSYNVHSKLCSLSYFILMYMLCLYGSKVSHIIMD